MNQSPETWLRRQLSDHRCRRRLTNCQFKKGDVTLPAAPLGRQGGIDVRKPFSIALLGFATLLSACSGGTTANNTGNESINASSESNASAASNTTGPARRSRTSEEDYPTRELARQGYEARLDCASQLEAAKVLTGRQVQAAPEGARRDRLVSQEMSFRGRAGAMRAYASRPAQILELSMAETNEDIERRSAAIVNGRGRVPLGDYAEQVTDRAMECYERLGN